MVNTKEQEYWTKRYQEESTGWDIGYPSTPLKEYINHLEDKTISIAVLAANANSSNPGPVITSLINKGIGSFHVPITIVPGSITDYELESIA